MLLVRSLNCCTNCGALTPWGPNAGPTGGAGVAFPAGHCSFTYATTFFFAIVYSFVVMYPTDTIEAAKPLPLSKDKREIIKEKRMMCKHNSLPTLRLLTTILLSSLSPFCFIFRYIFSTCRKSTSTGAFLPKIPTITLNLLFSWFTSSMVPVNDSNGPSIILT